MPLYVNYFSADDISLAANWASVITTVVVFLWFLLTQWQQRSTNLYTDFIGKYAGYTLTVLNKALGCEAGMILKINKIDTKGYFFGELHFGEVNKQTMEQYHDSMQTFYGRLDYRLPVPRRRHPFTYSKNHRYLGKLWIVDRLDFHLSEDSIEKYVSEEFDLIFFRELGVIRLNFVKPGIRNNNLPGTIYLFKSQDLEFEPYKTVPRVIFLNGSIKP